MIPVCLAVASLPEASVPLPGLVAGLAQVYQTEQAGPSHSGHRDGPQLPATMDHLLHIPQWGPPAVLEPAQMLALLGENGY